MAKSATVCKIKETTVNMELLRQIGNGDVRFIAQTEDAEALLLHNPPLIEVDFNSPNPENKREIACRVTAEGAALINVQFNERKNPMTSFEIMSGVELPASKRGGRGGGAPSKYPFDQLEVGQSFFVAVTSTMPDPVKKLGSTVSSANHRYAKETGEVKTIERSKRGAKNRLILDANGHKIMEQKEVPVLEFTRKFTIRPVNSGVRYGNWVAPANGAVIARVA